MKQYYFLIIIFLIVSNSLPVFSLPFSGGHEKDFKHIIEGLSGDSLHSLLKETSKGVDIDFPRMFKDAFGSSPDFNHRILGHWGFEGSIPFDKEPYKSAFANYPKKDVARLWQQFVVQLTERTIELTGLPHRQAKALSGLLVNIHILGDYVPHPTTNIITQPLAHPDLIKRDIIKNLHRMFGNNSHFVNILTKELNAAYDKDPRKYAENILNILKKHNIGEKLYAIYGQFFSTKGIKYTPTEQSLVRSLFRSASSQSGSGNGNIHQLRKEMMKNAPDNSLFSVGLITSNGRLILIMKESGIAGTTVFAVEGGAACYQFIRGHIWQPEFIEKIEDAAIKSATVSGFTAIAIVLVPTGPTGVIIFAAGTGAYILTDNALVIWREHRNKRFLTVEDLEGIGIVYDPKIALGIHDPKIPLDFISEPKTPLNLVPDSNTPLSFSVHP